MRTFAIRTQIEFSVPTLAIVTLEQILILVVYKRYVAILALGYVTALFAHNVRAVSATVQKQYSLIAGRQALVESRYKLSRKHARIAVQDLVTHIYRFDLGHFTLVYSVVPRDRVFFFRCKYRKVAKKTG